METVGLFVCLCAFLKRPSAAVVRMYFCGLVTINVHIWLRVLPACIRANKLAQDCSLFLFMNGAV